MSCDTDTDLLAGEGIDPELAAYYVESRALQDALEDARDDYRAAQIDVRECPSESGLRRLAAAGRRVQAAAHALAAHYEDASNDAAFAGLFAPHWVSGRRGRPGE